jgi:transposase
MPNSHPYCSNKNCQLPNPETLNRLHQESKLTWEKIAKDIYQVSERTIRRHARQSEKENQKIKQTRGRKRKIDGVDLDWLRDYVVGISRLKVITQNTLAKMLDCSQSTICTSLKRAGVVYKGFTYQSIEQLRLKNRVKINHFINITLPHLLEIGSNIFFLDETGFHCNMTLRRGYG